MPRNTFVAGEVLTAAEMNSVADQTVMVFAGTAARGSAIPSPSEGMVTYRSDDDVVELFDGTSYKPVGAVLDVYHAQVSASQTFTGVAAAYTDLTDLSITLTPKSASSKFLISWNVGIVSDASFDIYVGVRVLRDASVIRTGEHLLDTSTFGSSTISANTLSYLDSPATTSSITYKLQGAQLATGSSVNIYISRNADGASNRLPSSMTILEVE